MNSAFRALIGWLGGEWPSTIHLQAAEEKQNGFCRYLVTNKVAFGVASYSAECRWLFTSTSMNNCKLLYYVFVAFFNNSVSLFIAVCLHLYLLQILSLYLKL